jgi:hypothetical protein
MRLHPTCPYSNIIIEAQQQVEQWVAAQKFSSFLVPLFLPDPVMLTHV